MYDASADPGDTQYDDPAASDDTSYSSSSDSGSGSEPSDSYYDDNPDDGDSAPASGLDTSGSSDDDTSSTDGVDTYTETVSEAATTGTAGSEPVENDAGMAEGTEASEPATATQDPAAEVDCAPTFPLSGVTTPEGTPTVASAAASMADTGIPAGDGAPVADASTGQVAPTTANASATSTDVAYPGTADPVTTTSPTSGNDDGYVPAEQASSFQGIPHGILSSEQEQAFVHTGWTSALVPDGQGGQVEVLQPAGVDPVTFQGQLQFLQSHLQNVIAQQQGAAAPIPGTNSGSGTPTSYDGAGNPTHVSYSGVVNPPPTMVQMGGNDPLYSGGQSTTGTFIPGVSMVEMGGPMRTAPGAPSPTLNDEYSTTGPAAVHRQLELMINQASSDGATSKLQGVTFDRSTGLVYGDGRPFDNYPEALGAERHPLGPAPS